MKKQAKRTLTILGTILIAIISNILTPENKTITKTMATIWSNFSIISLILCALVCVVFLIKWKIDDFIEAQNNKLAEIRLRNQILKKYSEEIFKTFALSKLDLEDQLNSVKETVIKNLPNDEKAFAEKILNE